MTRSAVPSEGVKRPISQLSFSSIHRTAKAGVDAPSPVPALAVLLGLVGLISFGILGALVGALGGVVLGRYGGRLLSTSSAAPELVPCTVCGDETLSATGRCPAHR